MAAGPRSLVGTYANNLLTGRVHLDPVAEVALQLLAETVHRSLVDFNRLANGLDVYVEQVDADLLFAVRAVPTGENFPSAKAQPALVEAVEAYAGLNDDVLAEKLDRARQPESLNLDLAPGDRAVNAFRSGRLLERDDIVGALDDVTPLDLRRSIDRVRAQLLFGVVDAEAPVAGRPLWAPDPVPGPEPASWNRRSRVKLRIGPGHEARARVRAGQSALELIAPAAGGHGRRDEKPFRMAVDLTAVAVRVDRGPISTTLIDRDDRRATIVWPAFAKTAPLRALVDQATPAGSVITAPTDSATAADLKPRLFRRRFVRSLLSLFLLIVVGFPVLFAWILPAIDDATTDYQTPVVTTVAPGQLITLANGSTVLLSDPTWGRLDLGAARQLLTAQVRYCGGGKTVDRNTAEDARNYVDPDRFHITGISQAASGVYNLNNNKPALEATELQQGQCTSGQIAFGIDGSSRPTGTKIHYRNGSGDDLTWTIN